jgi:DNA-directed RNA polymerase subunit RPC12/RpoP
MQWVVFLIVGYIWVTATEDWGWNGWVAFIFGCVCAGIIAGFWEAVFGKNLMDGDEKAAEAEDTNKSKSGFADTALKMGAGYGIGKLTGKKTYAYECRNCHHYEERSQHQKIGVKCPRCGRKAMHISKI